MLNCAHYHVDGGIAVAENFFFKRDDFLALGSIFFRNLVRSYISSHSISPWPGRALAYVLFLEKQVPGTFLMPSSQTNTFNEHSRLFQESLIMRLNSKRWTQLL